MGRTRKLGLIFVGLVGLSVGIVGVWHLVNRDRAPRSAAPEVQTAAKARSEKLGEIEPVKRGGDEPVKEIIPVELPTPYEYAVGPELLSYSDLVASLQETLAPGLERKIGRLRTTPFINNEAYYRGAQPNEPIIPGIGRSLRLVMWNIERGLRLDEIITAITDSKQFLRQVRERQGEDVPFSTLAKELEVLRSADVIVLNEVDWGLKRTGYRNVARVLAEALNMNWAYGVEFLEIDPITLGLEEFPEIEDVGDRRILQQQIQVDPDKVHALHGTAVLTRYPIDSASLEPFESQGHDWFGDELKKVSVLDKGMRQVAGAVFQEKFSREVRRGGRTSLIVSLDVPSLPGGKLVVGATHLENRAKPAIRESQMRELLLRLKKERSPVIIAGDLNTTGGDKTPTTLKREVYRRLGSKSFWADVGVKYATGVGLLYDATKRSVNFFKNHQDPTAKHVPLVAPNPERGLFELLEEFRFQDGTALDFRCDKKRTINGTQGTLANSNQRDGKGFAVTFEVERSLGPVGKLKLDWIFVKSYLEKPRDTRSLSENSASRKSGE